MAPRKLSEKVTKPSRHGESTSKAVNKRPVFKVTAKLLVKSAAKTLILKSTKERQLPGRSAKSPGSSAAKSSSRKPAKSPSRLIAKSPAREPVKPRGRTAAKSPTKKPIKSPGRSAKSSVKPSIKSLGRPAAKTPAKKSVKSPGRPAAKSQKRKPGRPVTKFAKSPVKKLAKAPGIPAKSLGKVRGRPGKSPVPAKSPMKIPMKPRGRPPKKSPAKSAPSRVMITATVIKKKSPRGRPSIRNPQKIKASPSKSALKVSSNKAPELRSSQRVLTSNSPVRRSPKKTPTKPTLSTPVVSPQKVIVIRSPKKAVTPRSSVKKIAVSNSKKSIHVTQISQPALLSTKKQILLSTATSPLPTKKTNVKAMPTPKPAFTSPPRPTRMISPPARLLEADIQQSPKRGVPAGQKQRALRLAPVFTSPPKPMHVVVPAKKRQSRSETRMAEKSDIHTTRRATSAPAGDQTTPIRSQIKKSTSKSAERLVPKLVSGGRHSHEKILVKEQSNKSTKKTHVIETSTKSTAKGTKIDGQKSSDKPVSPKSASHPCKHCGLMFRSLSDGELHEHRCNKNPRRTDTRYPCNKCSGTFTMSDLILHKKQAHPQRDHPQPDMSEIVPVPEVPEKTSASSPPVLAVGKKRAEAEQNLQAKKDIPTKKVAPTRQVKAPESLVLKVPVGGTLNDVIRQAVQAATNAGLIMSNKKIMISGQKVRSNATVTDAPRPKKTPQEAAKLKRKSQETAVDKTPTSAKRVRFEKLPAHVEKLPAHVENPSPVLKAGSRGKVPHKKKKITHVPNEAMQDEDSKSSQPKFFTCLDCGDIFSSRKRVSEHKGECPGVGKTSVYACMDCNTTFIGRNELTIHRREKHPSQKGTTKSSNVTIRSFKCSECELFFPMESEAKKHITEIHGGVGDSSMCNVVATPDALRSADWNKNISEEMVEEVIQNIVTGARNGQDSQSEDTNSSVESPAVVLNPGTSAIPIRTPVKPAVKQNISVKKDMPAKQNISNEPSISGEPKTPEEPKSAVLSASYSGDRKPGQCLDCFMKVSSRLELAKHKRHCQIAIQNRQLFCFVCSSSFRSYFELSRHKQEQHTGNPQNLKCIPCKIVYKTYCEWLEHQNKQHQGTPLRQQPVAPPKATTDKDNTKQLPNASAAAKKSLEKPAKQQEKPVKQVRGGKSESKRNTEPVKTQEVRTRSGRVVHKKKLDDEIIIEHVVKPKKVKNIPELSNPLGTIEIVPEDIEDVIDLRENFSKTTAVDQEKETSQLAQKCGSPGVMDVHIESEVNLDDRSILSFANGLVTISAEKANDYEIFVDAKEDGSSIELKLIRKEDNAQNPSKSDTPTTTPMKPQAKPIKQPATKKDLTPGAESKAKTPVAPMKVKSSIAPVKKATVSAIMKKPTGPTKKAIATTSSKKTQDVPVEKEKISPKANSSKTVAAASTSADKAPSTGNPPVDTTGKVVQKGKPFVIGGQTLVPIQFPPGFQLPGGATGGQKVFAIPSTNLPPGLLQLLAKQQKASSAAASWPPKLVPPKIVPKLATKVGVSKKRPGILLSSTKSAKNVEMPASLKGMTGAQLMARAQARILGRPLPPLAIEAAAIQAASGKTTPAASPIMAQTPTKVASPGKSKAEAKNTITIMPPCTTPPRKSIPSGKMRTPDKKRTPVKVTSEKKTTPVKKTTPLQKAMPVKKTTVKIAAVNQKSTVVNIMPKSHESRPSTYNDPLFVFQCTTCKTNFKSTAAINKHMQACIGEMAPPVKRQRMTRRRAGTDVWHMKPVVSQKSRASLGKEDESQGIEWFVASKSH